MEGDCQNVRGRFRFYQNGELVSESTNLITDTGKELILRKLADQGGTLAGAIGVGVSSTPAVAADTRLGFEVSRGTVTVVYPDTDNFYVIYKAQFPQEDEYTIYEAGLWSQGSDTLSGLFISRQLALFNPDNEVWTNSTTDTTHSRSSAKATRIDATSGNTTASRRAGILADLSGYSSQDSFNVAFYKPDANIAGITLVFESVGGSFRSTEINTAALSVGYHTVAVTKSGFTTTGVPDWSAITAYGVDVRATTTGYIVLDGLRVEDTDSLNTGYALVSHSILSTPLVKTSIAPMEVEYALEFSLGGG